MENLKFFKATKEDTVLPEFVKNQGEIKEIMLLHEGETRKPNEWTAVAIKFKSQNTTKILDQVVSMKADEYWGKKKGYHVFWWD